MPPYDLSQWTDYARGLNDPQSRGELAAHLALPGSESARRSVAAFEGLLAFARRDAELEPPADALRGAKLLGALLRPGGAGGEGWLSRLRSRLTFDSAATPLAFGVRHFGGDLGDDRQLIFQSDDYCVDLRLEREAARGSWVVVGQLLCEKDGVAPVPGVSMLATSEDRFVGRTRTGELGEFQAAGLPGADLRFFFLVSEEICLEVPVWSAYPKS